MLQFARNYYRSSQLPLEDLTQEAMMTMFENVQKDENFELTSDLKTYVIGILKNKVNEWLRKQLPVATFHQPGPSADDVLDPVDIGIAQGAITRWLDKDSDEERDELQQAVYDIVVNMPDPCKTVLWSYYWEGRSMKEIADIMNYSNARVATTQKSRCMAKLESAMAEIRNRLRL